MTQQREIIGLLPAGGQGTRISPLPCSKELYPIGFRSVDKQGSLRPKVVCHYLLEKYKQAEATKVFVILREGKWDIPAYLGDGTLLGLHLAYLMVHIPFGTPYTLDQAFPFVKNATILLGFPDILFQPEDAFKQLLARQTETKADVVLGLFPTNQPEKVDMVDVDDTGRIHHIVIKPPQTDLTYSWIIAVWTPVFTQFMHKYLTTDLGVRTPKKPELFVGDIFQAAIDAGLQVNSVLFPESTFLDIGSPENLIKAIQRNTVSSDTP